MVHVSSSLSSTTGESSRWRPKQRGIAYAIAGQEPRHSLKVSIVGVQRMSANPSIERTSSSKLRLLPAAAQVQRYGAESFMHLLHKLLVLLSTMLAAANHCHAASEHEMRIGAQVEQVCSESAILAIGKFLKVGAFKVPSDGAYPNGEAVIASAACKSSPTIAATSSRDDSKEATRKPFHFKLKYDGRKYHPEEMEHSFCKWREP